MTHPIDLAEGDHRPPVAVVLIAGLAACKLAVHLATNALGPYEFHRDEFLYMAMGEHLRLFGMDFPPAIAILSELTRGVLGDSLVALRLGPAVLGTVLLVMAALAARELGGGRFAQGLAAVAVFANLMFLRTANLFQPVVLDQLWWTAALFTLIVLCRTDDPRWWIGYGVACGLGLLSKFSILIFGVATLLALLVTPARRWLKTPWPWLAAGIAFAIGSPSVVGQIRLGFPVLDQMSALRGAQLSRVSPIAFLADQPMMGLGFFLAVVGMAALGVGRAWKRFRVVGWTAIMAIAVLLLARGKAYYAGPIYPVLYGAGAVVLERIRARPWGAVARWGLLGIIVAYALVTLPLGLPILAPPTMERYLVALGMQSATETNVGRQERLPQDYADMLNWQAQVREIARVYETLPAAEREQAVILASNYGEAGAVDFYGPRYGLPGAVAYVGTYWFFGPGDRPGNIVIAHGFERDDLTDHFASVVAVGHVTHPYAVSEERDLTVYLCRDPATTLQAVWPSLAGEQ